jgi:hemolysin III
MYHIQTDLRKKILFRKIDYVSIYFAILGSGAPFLLGPLKEFFGLEMFFLLLVLTGLGSIFKLTLFDKFLPFSLSTYCFMTFLGVCHFGYLHSLLPGWSLFYIILKIFFGLVGLVFFRWDSLPYNHSIWHLMVLAGSFSNFMSILHLLNI